MTVTYNGDDNYYNITKNSNIKVTKGDIPSGEVIEIITTSENITVVVNLPDAATGNVTVTINGTKYNIPLVDGKGNITIPVKPG